MRMLSMYLQRQGLLDDLDATLVSEVCISIGRVPFIHSIL